MGRAVQVLLLESRSALEPSANPKLRPRGWSLFVFPKIDDLPRQPTNRAKKRRILNRESALQLIAFARRVVVGRIRVQNPPLFGPVGAILPLRPDFPPDCRSSRGDTGLLASTPA